MKIITTFLFYLLVSINLIAQVNKETIFSKTPTNFVNDYENIFTPDEENILNLLIKNYQDSTSIEFCVVTLVDYFNTEAEIKNFSDRLGEKWGVGSSELDNGLMLVISINSRKWSISTGYGLEPLFTDDKSNRLAEKYLKPNFINEDYFKGTQEFLISVMDNIGYDGFGQLLEKEKIRKEKAKESLKNIGIDFFYILCVILSSYILSILFVYLIKIGLQKRKEYLKLSNDITNMHDNIIKLKLNILHILGKFPDNIQKIYDDNITHNDIKVNADTYTRLIYVQNTLISFKQLINSTNNIISSILIGKEELKKYLKNEYTYCELYLIDNLNEIMPDTSTELFTTIDFTNDRYLKLRNINNSLSGKINKFLKKVYRVNFILSASNNLDNEIDKLQSHYEKYKTEKKILLTLNIGNRLTSLAKIDIEKYINNVKEEINKSFLALEKHDFENANNHFGFYLTYVAVLTKSFSSVSDLIIQYKKSDKYVKENKSLINEQLDRISSKINNTGVKSYRKQKLDEIRADIKKFNNNIAFDIILASTLLKTILQACNTLFEDIEDDMKRNKEKR